MNANAFDSMIVPVIRGLFVAALLGGAAVGLARMLGAITACLRETADEAPAPAAPRSATAPEADLVPAEESLAAAGA